MPLHTRDMLPPVRELIEEHVSEIVEVPVEDVYERDGKTGVLVRVVDVGPDGVAKPRTVGGGNTVVTRPTGELVESFQTTEDGETWVTHEGSLKQVDLLCGDCGSLLKPANDRDFYYLLCSRLDERKHERFQRIEERDAELPNGSMGKALFEVTLVVESDEPYENCVLECDNEPAEWRN